MKKKSISILCAVILTVSMLTGCGSTEASGTEPVAKTGEVLTIFNYSEYLDPDMIEKFTDETGIEIKYEEAVTAEEMYTKYKSGAIDYDLICTCDYMVEKLINEGEAAPVDFSAMNNSANIGGKYWNIAKYFDPENKYALPYFYGTIGLLYDKTKVNAPITSWDVLFNGEYSGNIIMQDSVRDTFMITLKYLGYSLNTLNKDEINEAAELLKKQKPDVEAYLVDEARDEVVAGNAAIAVVYSGEAFLGNLYNPNLEYVIPSEGSNLWMDSWIVTKNCSNPEAAQKFLDFLCRKDVATANFEFIYYSTPNESVIKDMDDELKNNPAVCPPEGTLDNCEVCTQINPDITQYYSELWKEIKSQ